MTENEDLLMPSATYLKSGVHIGTKFKTGYMSKFIYKTRPDGLSVLNLSEIDKRLGIAANMMSHYDAQDILVVCRRENGWKAAKLFSKLTGIKVLIGRYPPGILTNPNLKTFIEPKLIMVTDPWPDRNTVADAQKIGIPVVALCDTNNQSNSIDLVVPCNNKGRKSLAIIFYVLAREFMKKKGILKGDELPEPLEKFEEE